MNQPQTMTEEKQVTTSSNKVYRTIWRWHFYLN